MKAVKMVFERLGYAGELTEITGGDLTGLRLIRYALESAYDSLPLDDYGFPFIMLESEHGRLSCSAEGEPAGGEWLHDMLVSAEITNLEASHE